MDFKNYQNKTLSTTTSRKPKDARIVFKKGLRRRHNHLWKFIIQDVPTYVVPEVVESKKNVGPDPPETGERRTTNNSVKYSRETVPRG